jgi:outer membrane protein assembly factor BamD (BamD/ComL family)
MILSVMRLQRFTLQALASGLIVCTAVNGFGEKKPQQQQIVKPIAGPRAAALRVTWLYISPDKGSQKVDRVQIGREMVVAEKSGPWIRVYANTDIAEEHHSDQPVFGANEVPPPVSGWMEAKGIVIENTPNGDQILMGAAANQEAEASDPRGAANAAHSARLLYRRLAEMFPNSPLAPEAAWRAADILWQIEKSDYASLPSAKERDPYMRNQMDEDALKKVIKMYPNTRQADLAAYDLIDNKLCGDWQGSTKCPEKEAEIFEKYATEHPDSPRAARALFEAVYRQAVLSDMYAADGNDKKQDEAHNRARDLTARLKDKYPQSDYNWRASALVYKLDQGVPVYGIDRQ